MPSTSSCTAPRSTCPHADIWGCTVQEMVAKGKEVIIGMSRDPQFGPLLLFGLGGIYVEVLKDVTFRVAPISRLEASEMINEIRSIPAAARRPRREAIRPGGCA